MPIRRFDNIDNAENMVATIQGTNCKRTARCVVINAGYFSAECKDKNLLNVKTNKFPELVNKVNWMIRQKISNFLPVVMHRTAAMVERHETESAIAKLRTNRLDGKSSIIFLSRKITMIIKTFSISPATPRNPWHSWIVSISAGLKGEWRVPFVFSEWFFTPHELFSEPFILENIKKILRTVVSTPSIFQHLHLCIRDVITPAFTHNTLC